MRQSLNAFSVFFHPNLMGRYNISMIYKNIAPWRKSQALADPSAGAFYTYFSSP